MDRGHHIRCKLGFNKLPALFRYPKLRPEQRLCGGCTQRHYDFWLDDADFGAQPGTASRNLLRIRLFVNAAFAARLPLEMFDHVGDINAGTIDPSLDQGRVHYSACWSNERLAG